MTSSESQPRMTIAPIYGQGYGPAALRSEVQRVLDSPKQFRKNDHYLAAFRMGQLVAGNELSAAQAELVLVSLHSIIDIPRSKAERQVKRGLRKGAEVPRTAAKNGQILKDSRQACLWIINWWQDVQLAIQDPMLLKILAAFALLSLSAGKVRISESYRELADAAGVSYQTVSNRRPQLDPWVRLVEAGDYHTGQRSLWQLVNPHAQEIDSPCTERPGSPASGLSKRCAGVKQLTSDVPIKGTLDDPAHDEWHRWAGGWRIWTLLAIDQYVTTRELAEVSGRSLHGVRHILRRMRKDGLAVYEKARGWRRAQENPQVAPYMDSPGERRRTIHKRQRREWRNARQAHFCKLATERGTSIEHEARTALGDGYGTRFRLGRPGEEHFAPLAPPCEAEHVPPSSPSNTPPQLPDRPSYGIQALLEGGV